MQSESCRLGPDDEPDNLDPAAIPEFARFWESAPQVASVRRPSVPPDPQSYHELIEPQTIFELDEKQEDGSIQTIFVVPIGCQQCKSLKQACSRARPACVRCRNAGRTCRIEQGGYQRLPGPRIVKLAYLAQKQHDGNGTRKASPAAQDLSKGRSLRGRRISSEAESSQSPRSPPNQSISTGSKRPLSPTPAPVPPQKKTQAKPVPRKKVTVTAPKDVNAKCPKVPATAQVVTASETSGLKWTFVKNHEETSPGPERDRPIPISANTLIPRVWTDTLGSLLLVFPELGKSTMGFSWFQSETPVLLLDADARGNWINPTTLRVDLLWEFSCHESQLEPVVEPTPGYSQYYSYQHGVYLLESTLDNGTVTMGPQYSHPPSGTGSFPPRVLVSVPHPTSSTQVLPSDDTPQATCGPYDEGTSSIRITTPDIHTTSQPRFNLRTPLNKPPEVETLLDSHSRFIPLLLWLSHDSGLVPCNLSPEYAYVSMGLFFISELRDSVVQHSASPATGLVRGHVRWSVTLLWAPGGEDALFDYESSNVDSDTAPVNATKDLSHPWWYDSMNASSNVDDATQYRPRDLRMQFFSFIPLDLLAKFHPSESFPRGWFCKLCGMINIQVYFRHQICQSSACKSMRNSGIPPGKVDSLSSLRDPLQSSVIVCPTRRIPSVVVSDSTMWDDGMQSWTYNVKERVMLCHIFTGNQENLQQDATALLKRIQCEVLLRKEDPSSPYFMHSTRLSYPRDGSEAMVPGGTPNCIRTAYYTLCDFMPRYGEMESPRFGEVRILAWVNSGSKRGNVLHASKSPVVIHCLGADVTLNFTPKGGYKDATDSTPPDKGKALAEEGDRAGSPSMTPCAGASRPLDNQTPFNPRPDANETPIVAENAVEDIAAMDTICDSQDAGGTVISGSNTADLGTEAASHEVVERRVRKKNKVTVKASVPEISMTLVHGDCIFLCGDDFECQIVRSGTTVLVIGFPEET